jgi:hypothetical protein
MNIKYFFLLILFFSISLHSFTEFSLQEKDSPFFYIWMGEGKNHSDEYLEEQFEKLRGAGVDGIMYMCSADRYSEVISIAERVGLELHAWQVILNCRDEKVMNEHKDWFTVNAKGVSSLIQPPFVGYYKWLCPSNDQVQEYVIKKISGLANIKGLKSIHLDYIRYSDVILPIGLWSKYNLVMDREYPEFDFCYCEVCIRKFKRQAGIDPSKLKDPSHNPEWRQYRYDSITALVNKLADAVHKKGKLLTAAVFPTPSIAKKMVRQDWVNWNLDMVYPMIYHSFYEKDVAWIKEAVEEGVVALGGKIPLISGLYTPSLSPDELGKAIDGSIEGGADGICLFGSEGMSKEHWEIFSKSRQKYIREKENKHEGP